MVIKIHEFTDILYDDVTDRKREVRYWLISYSEISNDTALESEFVLWVKNNLKSTHRLYQPKRIVYTESEQDVTMLKLRW